MLSTYESAAYESSAEGESDDESDCSMASSDANATDENEVV